ncbi:hypothetical protein FOWG_18061 [Fusarium oxysporum f. sp. lycopersici MN25]|nr:hypothetical protein FOWG_18061 [Fusarium oxysporum f. sp. lycopersici MN25]
MRLSDKPSSSTTMLRPDLYYSTNVIRVQALNLVTIPDDNGLALLCHKLQSQDKARLVGQRLRMRASRCWSRMTGGRRITGREVEIGHRIYSIASRGRIQTGCSNEKG